LLLMPPAFAEPVEFWRAIAPDREPRTLAVVASLPLRSHDRWQEDARMALSGRRGVSALAHLYVLSRATWTMAERSSRTVTLPRATCSARPPPLLLPAGHIQRASAATAPFFGSIQGKRTLTDLRRSISLAALRQSDSDGRRTGLTYVESKFLLRRRPDRKLKSSLGSSSELPKTLEVERQLSGIRGL